MFDEGVIFGDRRKYFDRESRLKNIEIDRARVAGPKRRRNEVSEIRMIV